MKCKNCGAEIKLNLIKDGVAECEYCFSVTTLPKETNSGAEQFLHIGEHELDTGRFSEAFEAYKKASELDGSEPESYWGMALSEFKVQYLKDGVNDKLQPVCHAIKEECIQKNPHYLQAIRYATVSQRAVYEKRAKEIDYIRNEFYKLERSGLDYDCFLCVKVTDDVTKERTADYKVADDIYFALRGKGYKPFFSERELGNVTGADYEARILYALMKSECMLVVCSNEEYLNTKWVKNEYTRFLRLMNDEEKESDAITVVFSGRPIEHLPGKSGKIQGIDLNNINAIERITLFVDRHTPAVSKLRKELEANRGMAQDVLLRQIEESKRAQWELEERLKNLNSAKSQAADISAESSMKRARMEQADGNYKAAKEYYTRVIELEPENGEAWWGLFLSEQNVSDGKSLYAKMTSSEVISKWLTDQSFIRAQRYAKGGLADEIAAFEKKCKSDRAELLGREEEEKRRKKEEILRRDWVIANGVLTEYRGSDVNVEIPDGVTEIAREVFSGKLIEKVIIPSSVKIIGERAFKDCKRLGEVMFSTRADLPASVTKIGMEAFRGCQSLAAIRLPVSLKEIEKRTFMGCTYLSSVTIPDQVESIACGAFDACPHLSYVAIHKSVRRIGEDAFPAQLSQIGYDGTKKEWRQIRIVGRRFRKRLNAARRTAAHTAQLLGHGKWK